MKKLIGVVIAVLVVVGLVFAMNGNKTDEEPKVLPEDNYHEEVEKNLIDLNVLEKTDTSCKYTYVEDDKKYYVEETFTTDFNVIDSKVYEDVNGELELVKTMHSTSDSKGMTVEITDKDGNKTTEYHKFGSEEE